MRKGEFSRQAGGYPHDVANECIHHHPKNRHNRGSVPRPRYTDADAANDLALEREQVELVAPPFVQPHEQATKQKPKIVAFRMETQEKEIVIDDEGTKLQAMTFNGSIPGPMMV